MHYVLLLPPSEWKQPWGDMTWSSLSFDFLENPWLPLDIATHATPKDLKCSWARYDEWIALNKTMQDWPRMKAQERYNWVMYDAIDSDSMSTLWRQRYADHVLIVSWMYGLLKPTDLIANYKLPIETKWLLAYRWEQVTTTLQEQNYEYIIDLLPWAYKKLINFSKLWCPVISVDFFHQKNESSERTKMTHGVKKVKWKWVNQLTQTWWDRKKATNYIQKEYNVMVVDTTLP